MIEGFVESAATLPAPNEREDLIKQLDGDRHQLRELCWKARPIYNRFLEARSNFGQGSDIDALLALQNELTNAERTINDLSASIDSRAKAWNCGRNQHERIYISHTEEGLPICVSKNRKIPFFGQ